VSEARLACGWSAASPQPPVANGVRLLAVLGKAEGLGEDWHGHVTAVTVAPTYRRQRLADKLMQLLEDITIKRHDGYFVDLFVRVTNAAAITMYEKVGGRCALLG
jgi:N-terminal acetyltransferase B complex catalytic subunit